MEGSVSSGNVVLRILKFLLFKLWLWVPVAYSLLFVIVVAVTRTAFSSVWGIYVIGLCVTLVLAIAFACTNFARRIGKNKVEKGRSSSYAKEMNTNRDKAQFIAGVDGDNSTPTITRSAPQDQPQSQQPQQSQQPNNQPYAQQPYNQQQSQQPQNGNFGNNTNGSETSTSATSQFYGYNIDRGPQRHEYTGGDPGFFSYYPERDAANNRNTDSFVNNDFSRNNGSNGFGRDGFNSSSDNGFNRDGFNSSSDSGFSRDGFNSSSDNGFNRDGGSDFSRSGFDGSGFGDFSRQSYSRGSGGDSIVFPSAVPEKPAIFRTRMDPNMLIYEYSDRLEFYKITDNGPILLSSEYKNNNR